MVNRILDYKLEICIEDKNTHNIEDIDMRYYWDTINTLLDKFGLKRYIRKRPSLTLIDKKQQSLMEWM